MSKKTRAHAQSRPAPRPQPARQQQQQPTIPQVPGALGAIGAFYGRAIPKNLQALRWDTRAKLVLALFAALWLAFLAAGVYAVSSGGFGQGVGYGIVGLLLGIVLSVLVGLVPFGFVFRGVMATERREYDRFAITKPQRNLPVRVSFWLQKTARQTLAKQGMPSARIAPRPPARKGR